MREWIVENARYFLSDWENLLVGGVIVVSVVIFLMGILKVLLVNKIKNELLRKVILAWSSLVVVLPVTAIYVVVKGVNMDYFWSVYAVNCIATILIYWLYENTALRTSLHKIGKKVVMAFISNEKKPKINAKEILTEVVKDLSNTAEESTKSETPKYKDNDLDNI